MILFKLSGHSSTSVMLFIAMLYFASVVMNASQAAVVSSSESSSVPVTIGGGNNWVYSVRCWQEGKEIISETNFEWSAQSTRMPVREWLTFTGIDSKSQLTVMPVGTAVCQIHGRSRVR
ncbi:MAG: hypothetical protein KDJ34_10720 [Candidatus Competibacteraceae bacterium]|nr:hypothetical protein [Candidatus Competibacteraceae bacterium]